MNERNLSRRLSSSVVEALKAHGHILVVKGGATALARELDDLMVPEISLIEPRLQPHAPLVGEPTSTFGDETVDQAVEDMVLKLTHALMNSDHVEDVFAEDAVIRRDIFRVVRDGLREPMIDGGDGGGDDDDHASVTVKLDSLGYVAATASRLTEASALREALDRAASVAGARFSGFSPELREATFRLEGNGIDERLEIEEAVADELTDLVEQGVVELPTLERRIDLGRALSTAEQRALFTRIDAAADATLHRSGCAAAWELESPRTLRVLFTPLSEQDALGVDAPTGAFAREIAALLSSGGASAKASAKAPAVAPPAEPTPAPPSAGPKRRGKEAAEPSRPASIPNLGNARERSPTGAAKERPAPPSAPKAPAAKKTAKAATTKAGTAKKTAAKTPASSQKGTAAKAPGSSQKGTAAKTPAASRKTTATKTPAAAKASAPKSTGKRAPAAAAKTTKATKAPAKKR